MFTTIRTPLRVSFFGGGSDFPEYFSEYGASVLGMAINKYIYISALELGDYVDYRFRVSYSKHERVRSIHELEHPVVRAALRLSAWSRPLDVSILSDLPARSGLGSSSAFTVGFLHLLASLQSQCLSKHNLAVNAAKLERDELKENVGFQDQFHTSFGGLNRFDFSKDGAIDVRPIDLSDGRVSELVSTFYLLDTSITRLSTEMQSAHIENICSRKIVSKLHESVELVNEAMRIFSSNSISFVDEFSRLLREAWQLKKSFSESITSDIVDNLYNRAITAGALSGKLCGAGGGGFLLLQIKQDRHESVSKALSPIRLIPISADTFGSTRII